MTHDNNNNLIAIAIKLPIQLLLLFFDLEFELWALRGTATRSKTKFTRESPARGLKSMILTSSN